MEMLLHHTLFYLKDMTSELEDAKLCLMGHQCIFKTSNIKKNEGWHLGREYLFDSLGDQHMHFQDLRTPSIC